MRLSIGAEGVSRERARVLNREENEEKRKEKENVRCTRFSRVWFEPSCPWKVSMRASASRYKSVL